METICNNHNLTLNVTDDTMSQSEDIFILWVIVPFSLMVIILGLPLNTLTICILLAKPDIRSTSDIFTLTTAILDFLFCLCFSVETILSFRNLHGTVPYVSFGVNQFGGPLVLTFLCLDSYVAVCYPLLFLRFKSPKYRTTLCAVICVLTSAFFTAQIFLTPGYKWTVILSVIVMSLVTTSICNILVLWSLTHPRHGRKEIHPVKKRAFKIVLTTLVLINVHYIPTLVESNFRRFSSEMFCSHPFLRYISYIMLSLGSLTQPMGYLLRTKQLAAVKVFCSAVKKAVLSDQWCNSAGGRV